MKNKENKTIYSNSKIKNSAKISGKNTRNKIIEGLFAVHILSILNDDAQVSCVTWDIFIITQNVI